jgi:hypothetical protein
MLIVLKQDQVEAFQINCRQYIYREHNLTRALPIPLYLSIAVDPEVPELFLWTTVVEISTKTPFSQRIKGLSLSKTAS